MKWNKTQLKSVKKGASTCSEHIMSTLPSMQSLSIYNYYISIAMQITLVKLVISTIEGLFVFELISSMRIGEDIFTFWDK